MPRAPTRRLVACALALLSASACGSTGASDDQERVLGRSTLGTTALELVVTRSGLDIGFGAGPGRGGFLDPAHKTRTIRVVARVLEKGVERPFSETTYEAWVRECLLLEKTWDTNDDDEAISAWERAWSNAAIERCDWPNDIALRVRRGHGLRSKWARAHRDASGVVTMSDATVAESCASLRATAPIR